MTDDSLSAATPSSTTTLVTVTYADRIDYLRELLRRAFGNEQVGHAVVVSNASTSDLRLLENEWGARLRVIRLERNTGSANGYAVGIEAALADGADFLWLMDDDNAPKPGALANLHRRLGQSTRNLGLARAAVLGFRPTHQADVARGVDVSRAYPPRSSFFGFHYRQIFFKIWRRTPLGKTNPAQASQAPAPIVPLPYAPYGGLLASRALFERIGLPMRELVLYADDTEYTRRITADGGVIELVTGAKLEDLEGSWNLKDSYANTFLGWLQGGSDLRAFYAARNQAFFDRHIWASNMPEYFLNQFLYFVLLRYFSLRTGRLERHRLLRNAIRSGKRSILGPSSDHTL